MPRLGFFDILSDDALSWREAQAINHAHDAADTALAQADIHAQSIGEMRAMLRAQARELAMLRAAMGVLAGLLRDNGLVDPKVLDYRLEAAMDDGAAEHEESVSSAVCLRCSTELPLAQTVMTENGPVCDRCHALGG
jgi:hypothetical protein